LKISLCIWQFYFTTDIFFSICFIVLSFLGTFEN